MNASRFRTLVDFIDHEIEWEKRVVAAGATELDRSRAQERLQELEVAKLAVGADLAHAMAGRRRWLKWAALGFSGLVLIGLITYWVS